MVALDPNPPRTALDNAVVLLVDDEPEALSALRRVLRGQCIVHTETDPFAALELAGEIDGLAVIVSDMRMPGMDGATFLSKVRHIAPDAVRVLLTGQRDVNAAVSAINDGRIFRFLWKPVTREALHACLRDAVAQHRLLTAERELLERTLRGSVRALLETLSLANPLAFSRAERIKTRVAGLAAHFTDADAWEIEVVAMLSQLGAITLPPHVNERLHLGEPIGGSAADLVARIPQISADLLSDVPRLETVRRSILLQRQRYDGHGPVDHVTARDVIPLAARVLHVAIDYDAFEARGVASRSAITTMRSESGRYDPDVLDVLERVVTRGDDANPIEQLPLSELRSGHVLAADLTTEDGVLLCGRGQEVTDRLLQRLENWARSQRVAEPVHVLHDESRTGT